MARSLSPGPRCFVSRTRTVFLTILASVSALTLHAADSVKLSDLQQAQKATEVTSGQIVGIGVYRATMQRKKQAANYVAKIIARYNASNYLVDLQYQQSPDQHRRQVFLCDGSIVLQATFSPGIHPLGAEGEVFPRPVRGWPSLTFPLDVRRLGNQAVNFETVLKRVPAEKISLVHKNGPEWEGKYSIGKTFDVTFTVSELAGLNPTRLIAGNPDRTVYSEYTLGWKKVSDRWVVEHFTEKRLVGNPHAASFDLHFDSLKLETVPRPELFTISALGLPLGARILDHRPGIDRDFRIRYYDGAGSASPEKALPLTEQLEELPTRKIDFTQPQPLGTAPLAAEGAAPSAGKELPTFLLHGTVVDEQGTAVPHVTIATPAGRDPDVDLAAVSDAGGNFTLDVPTWQSQVNLWAKEEAGSRIGSLHDVPGKAHQPARIVLHAARSIPVTLVDGKRRPIAGAKVGVSFRNRNGVLFGDRARERLVGEQTDAKGQAVLHLPPEIPLDSVWAVKAGAGFDYILYRRPIDEPQLTKQPPADPAMRAPDDSRPIQFVFAGVQKVRVHVLNERRRPLPGVRICMRYLERPNRGDGVTVSQIDEFVATADSTGTAEFTAVPIETLPETAFQSATVGFYEMDYAVLKSPAPLTEVTIIVRAIPVLRVQVTYPDGRPALGARVLFNGNQYGRIRSMFSGEILYQTPGETVTHAFHGDSYCVVSATIEGYASKLEARVVRIGDPLRSVHLVLKPATRLHGTLTVGKEGRPAANESVTLIQRDQDNYSRLPEDERLPRTLPLAEREHVTMDLLLHTATDEQGRFQFDAAPGAYLIGAGHVALGDIRRVKDVKEAYPEGARELEIKDEKEITIDLHSDAPPSAIKWSARSRRATGAKAGS
ncbi:MAG TPA: carboxypeptidase-like regulatory domain-containing protein [Planctomycetaceae bacterium]|jgi:hypothetical protein|nr:carboxypeptidase-like regulatory domain-containing protein [Planctomycetaceae bacterium]